MIKGPRMLSYANLYPDRSTLVLTDTEETPARRLLQVATDVLNGSDLPRATYELSLSECLRDYDLPDELSSRTDAVWVDQISALPPGRGTGRRVLGLLLEAADSEGVALALVPTAFARVGALKYEALVDWYERSGFLPWGAQGCVWVREAVE